MKEFRSIEQEISSVLCFLALLCVCFLTLEQCKGKHAEPRTMYAEKQR